MKFLITAGGTGGHLFPAQALARQLKELIPDCSILFAAGGLSKNRYFDSTAFTFVEIATAKVSIKKPLKTCLGLFSLLNGYCQSRKLIHSYKPTVVIGFGSFTTYPVLLAAKHKNIPFVLHEANAVPGLVNRLFAAKARFTGIFFPETAQRLTGKTLIVSTPLKRDRSITREEAYEYFGLVPGQKTLLVFGGSQGAMALNDLMCDVAPDLKALQILHFTGRAEATSRCSKRYRECSIQAVVKDFESRMDFAWKIADLALTRSGSSTIAEQIESEVPAIFVPYPFATDCHQHSNARFVEAEVKGGLVVDQGDLTPGRLMDVLNALLSQASEMKERIRAYKMQRGAPFAQEILKVIEPHVATYFPTVGS